MPNGERRFVIAMADFGNDERTFSLPIAGYAHPAPANLIAYPRDRVASLTWTPIPDAIGYSVYRNGAKVVIGTATMPYADTGLSNDMRYEYQVSGQFLDGEGPRSASTTVRPFFGTFAAPSQVLPIGDDRVVNVFFSAVPGADRYHVYWGDSRGITHDDSRVSVIASPFAHTTVLNGSRYYYRVSSVSGGQGSPLSPEFSAVAGAPAVPVFGGSATAEVGADRITVTWPAQTDAAGYVLLRNGNLLATAAVSPYIDGSLPRAGAYRYEVRAAYASGALGRPSDQAVGIWSDRTVRVGEVAIPFVAVPGGTFMMGGESPYGGNDTWPPHPVTVSPFDMQVTEVTMAQYWAVIGDQHWPFREAPVFPSLPMTEVTWYDAVRFCNALSVSQGLTPCYTGPSGEVGSSTIAYGDTVICNWSANGFRLPTEAEWEYACRAGTTSPYYWGDSIDVAVMGQHAWCGSNSDRTVHPVGLKTANAWGLCDMSGNVWEWCWDWIENVYERGAQSDPRGPLSGTLRVLRGGSCEGNLEYCRSTYRGEYAPGNTVWMRGGFRVVRSGE